MAKKPKLNPPPVLGGLKAPDKPSQKLIDRVVELIRKDINDDWDSIEELLRFCPVENLIAFLPEEEWTKFTKK